MQHLNEAHNGYIEIYLNLGWVGVCLLAIILISGYRRAVSAFRGNSAVGSLVVGLCRDCCNLQHNGGWLQNADSKLDFPIAGCSCRGRHGRRRGGERSALRFAVRELVELPDGRPARRLPWSRLVGTLETFRFEWRFLPGCSGPGVAADCRPRRQRDGLCGRCVVRCAGCGYRGPGAVAHPG